MNKRLVSIGLLLLANSIFGFSFLFTKTALSYTSPMVLISERFVLAFLILNLLLLTGKFSLNLKGKPIIKLLIMGFIQPVLYFVFETYGLSMCSSSYAGILIGLVPIFGLILGKIMLNQDIKKIQVLFVAVSIIGVALTSIGGEIMMSVLGTILLLMSVFSGTLYTVLSSKISNEFSAFERTYVMFLLGSICFTVSALVTVNFDMNLFIKPLSSISYIGCLMYLGAISSVLAFFSINYALSYVEVYINGILANFATLVSVIAGVVIMHDVFTLTQAVGIVLILISVIGVSISQKDK